MKIDDYIKDIGYIESHDIDEVNKQEKELKGEYKKKNREIKSIEEREAQDKKKAELRARMERVYEKTGRTGMARSMKKKVKREKIVVAENQDLIDQRKYLGELMPT